MAAAAKKTDKAEATERTVDVTVPSGQGGIAVNDIYKAALTGVRDEIPLRSDLVHEIVGSDKKGSERVYHVKISWGPHEARLGESEPEDGNFVAQHIDTLDVPKSMPVTVEDKG